MQVRGHRIAVRRSTVGLAAAFVVLLVTYFLVRPVPVATVQRRLQERAVSTPIPTRTRAPSLTPSAPPPTTSTPPPPATSTAPATPVTSTRESAPGSSTPAPSTPTTASSPGSATTSAS